MAAEAIDTLVLGRGVLYFDPFVKGTKTKTGERDFGESPGFTINVTVSKLDKYSSRSGTRQKIRSIPLETTRAGQIVTENISTSNLALVLLGSTVTLTSTAATVTDEPISDVIQGRYYQLGTSAGNPAGVVDLNSGTAAVVKVSSTAKALGTDYTIDYAKGRIYIVPGGTITDGTDITVTYTTKAGSRTRIVSGSDPIEGALRFISDNPEGPDKVYYFPYVSLTPNGDLALIGDQEVMQATFDVEVLKLNDSTASVYCDGAELLVA